MDCATARELIRDFVEEKLELPEQRGFLKHVENCDDCMFELETGYLMYTGIRKMDAGEEFDFEKGFEGLLSDSRCFVKLASRAKFGLLILFFICTLSLFLFAIGIFAL